MSLRALFASQLTDSDPEARDVLGAIREGGDGKRYKYVKFITSTVVAGDAVKYADSAGYTANEVLPNATPAATVAGVALATQAVNQFGWIQISGKVTLSAAPTGTASDGGALISSGTTKKLAVATPTDIQRPCGVMLDAAAPTIAILDCPV